jgi:SAM-dependent methyltransferase
MSHPQCRNCEAPLEDVFADLGQTPLANSYVPPERLDELEPRFPLKAFACRRCFLVQLEEFEAPEGIFSDYAYFSSWSASWLEHSAAYADMITKRLGLGPESQVVEVASNDGYLLQYFQRGGIPVLGIEPAANVAKHAESKGIPTKVEFFGANVAKDLAADHAADLLVGNNVLAHVPDLHDFVEGLAQLLKPHGTITMEFPHLLRLIDEVQFDTIYHEHFSYFSLRTASDVFAQHGLQIYDVDRLSTHGGSLRIYARHEDGRSVESNVDAILSEEIAAGLQNIETYLSFNDAVHSEQERIVAKLNEIAAAGETIAGYGAPAKGNTLLNSCGIGPDLVRFTVDANPVKQGTFLPGSHIPVLRPEAIDEQRPDRIWILPWNIADEIRQQLTHVQDWGARFIVRNPGQGLEG